MSKYLQSKEISPEEKVTTPWGFSWLEFAPSLPVSSHAGGVANVCAGRENQPPLKVVIALMTNKAETRSTNYTGAGALPTAPYEVFNS